MPPTRPASIALVHDPVDETLGTQVLAYLRAQLITGMLAPGDKVSLRPLANRLGVSMQPVRDAVARLVAEQALVVTPKRSVQVPVMSLPRFRELTAIRQVVEGFAAGEAARRRGREELAAMRRFESVFRRETRRREPDVDVAIVANANLHFAVYRAAAMPALVAIIEGLWLRIGPVLNLDLRDGENRLRSGVAAGCHRDLVDAVGRGDARAARDAVQRDIGSTAAFIEARDVLSRE